VAASSQGCGLTKFKVELKICSEKNIYIKTEVRAKAIACPFSCTQDTVVCYPLRLYHDRGLSDQAFIVKVVFSEGFPWLMQGKNLLI
jgi:hypothetical protein